jgi:two-component system cell cycle response regulator
MSDETFLSPKDILMLFNYATRLIAIESNVEVIFERSLEALSVFAANGKVALYTMGKEKGTLQLEGAFVDMKYRSIKTKMTYLNSPFERVINEKQYDLLFASQNDDFPAPATDPHPQGAHCLCVPMAGTSNDIMGILTIEGNQDRTWSVLDIQIFIIFSTVIAVSIENSRLYNLATVDHLTGLFVRAFFEIRLQEEIARLKRSGGSFSVLLFDIDHFKEINDVYGHYHGDVVLKGVAAVLEAAVRKGVDIPCRYGGDEFIILAIGAGPEDSVRLADRIKRQCESRPFSLGGDLRKVTLSGGLVHVDTQRFADCKTIVDRADQMLYRAKNLGRNKICTWEDDL